MSEEYSGGLLKCAVCGQKAPHVGGKLKLHYPSNGAMKPCLNSWPQPKGKNGVKKP